MTCFHVLRHAETDSLGRVLAGRSGPGLNATGLAQATALAETLAGLDVAAIISSPQLRTRQTADAVANVLHLPVRVDARLDEIDFGDWTGRTFDNLADLPAWRAWNTRRSLAPAPGTETMPAAQARATGVLLSLHAEAPDRTFVLISHADIIKALLCHALSLTLDLMQRIEVSPASHSIIRLQGGGMTVRMVNATAGWPT